MPTELHPTNVIPSDYADFNITFTYSGVIERSPYNWISKNGCGGDEWMDPSARVYFGDLTTTLENGSACNTVFSLHLQESNAGSLSTCSIQDSEKKMSNICSCGGGIRVNISDNGTAKPFNYCGKDIGFALYVSPCCYIKFGLIGGKTVINEQGIEVVSQEFPGRLVMGDICDSGGEALELNHCVWNPQTNQFEYASNIGTASVEKMTDNQSPSFELLTCDDGSEDSDCVKSNLSSSSDCSLQIKLSNTDYEQVYDIDIGSNQGFTFIDNSSGIFDSDENLDVELVSSSDDIVSYVGGDKCIRIFPFGNDKDFLGFYLKSGSDSDGFVCSNNYGQLYFCGKNCPSISDDNFIDGDFDENGDFQENNVNSYSIDLKVIDSNGNLDFSCDCSHDDDVEKFDLQECNFCVSDIDVCCEDESFISDVNDFSSITIPDTYINPDTGTEERLPWNGLMWVSKCLISTAKVFYVYFHQLFCDFSNLLKEISNKFIELGNNFNNLIDKIFIYNNKGLAEILYKGLFKDITKDGVSQDVSALDSIDVTISDRIKDLEDKLLCDDDSLACIIKNKDLSVTTGNSLPIVNTSSDLLLNQIKDKLGNINDNLKCDDDSLACIVKNKDNAVTVNPSETVVDVTIEANNSAFVSKAKYDFTDE